jgi:hypothetical protein
MEQLRYDCLRSGICGNRAGLDEKRGEIKIEMPTARATELWECV